MSATNNDSIDKVYVIGGEAIYKEAIESSLCSRIYLTEILSEINEVDTFFPNIPPRYNQIALSDTIIENNVEYRFAEYELIKL